MVLTRLGGLCLGLAGATAMHAQDSVAVIPAADITHHLAALAAESLRVRPTPSAGLDAAARYVATEFQRLGLQVDTTRYPLPGQQQVSADSRVSFYLRLEHKGKHVIAPEKDGTASRVVKEAHFTFATGFYFTGEVGPQTIVLTRMPWLVGNPYYYMKPLTLVAGRPTVAALRQARARLEDRAVLYVPPADMDSAGRQQIVAALYALSRGVIVVGPDDSARFAAERTRYAGRAEYVDDYLKVGTGAEDRSWAVVVWGGPLREWLRAAGEDLDQLRRDTTAVVRAFPPSRMVEPLIRPAQESAMGLATAPNVVGVLRGRGDSEVARDQLIVAAPLDARDEGAAVAGLLALARAFTQGSTPRRSVVFLATSGGTPSDSVLSGGTPEFWGANYFIRSLSKSDRGRSMALAFGGLRAPLGDSILVDGLREVELAPSLPWVAAMHPELGLRVVDGGSVTRPTADHFAFVRAAVPSLYVHPGATGTAPSPAAIDAEQIARGVRFVFHLAQTIANADTRPRWTTEGRQRLGTILVP